MGRSKRPEHLWVLDYHLPGAKMAPSPRLRRGDDDDELDEEEPAVVAAGVVLDQLNVLYGHGEVAEGPLAAEVVRIVGDDIIDVELVLPGESRGPLSGARAEVAVEVDGRCLLTVPDRAAEVVISASREEESTEEAPCVEVEVPPEGRALVRHGEATLLVRPVVPPEAPKPKGGRAKLAVVLLVCAIVVVSFFFLVRWAFV